MSDKENTQEENIQVDEAFGELLANFVRKNPCLYDKKCKEYKDKKFIADTWSSIANACGMSETSTPSEYSANSDSSATSTLVSQPRLAIPKKNLLVPPPDQFASRKRSYKEQEQLSLMIGNTNEAINKLVHNLSEKCSQPVSDDKEDGEEAAIAKAFLYALKKF
ncbi:transcription factor adf-1 [Lasius niger]|uniref:Transcription factor adf-1 n=1 Tax=Lasius niger TaxID=67767 RepID=A0A0J7K451_LASNI|nr:transcription factor adf-1 [Lasius niger]